MTAVGQQALVVGQELRSFLSEYEQPAAGRYAVRDDDEDAAAYAAEVAFKTKVNRHMMGKVRDLTSLQLQDALAAATAERALLDEDACPYKGVQPDGHGSVQRRIWAENNPTASSRRLPQSTGQVCTVP